MSSADAIGPAAPLPESDPPPADAFSGLIDRATSRLQSDSDLRLEIAQELRGHLHDSAAEYRAAGVGEAEAEAKAVEAMGDPMALADQLWQANRGRMRRRAVVSWAFGVLAAPVALAICFSLVWGVVTSLSLLTLTGLMDARRPDSGFPLSVGRGPARLAWQRLVDRLRPEDRIAIHGEEVGIPSLNEFRVQQARAVAERWPNDPVYAANYVTQSLINPGLFKEPEKTDRAALQTLLARLDHAATVEPNNGYYALLKAAALMNVSSHLVEEPDDRKPGYDYVDEHGKPQETRFDRIEVLDAATFERGLTAFREAAHKPYIDSHAVEMAKRQAERFPAPTQLSDYLLQTSFTISTLLPYLNQYRHAATLAGGHAIALAQRGDAAAADALVADERRVGLLATESSSFIVEALVGDGIASSARGHEVGVDKLLGRTDAAARALAALRAEERRGREVRHPAMDPAAAEAARREAGLIQSATLFGPAGVGRDTALGADLGPGRRAEYAVADQLALSVLAFALLLAAGARAALIGASAFARRRSGQPAARPFIGSRRVMRIVLLGGVLPLSLYGLYCYLPISGRGNGLPTTGPRVVLEYAAVAAVVAFLLRLLTERAVRRRFAELGLPAEPARGARWAGSLGMLIVLTVAFGVVAWQVFTAATTTGSSALHWGLPLALAVAAAAYAGAHFGDLRMPASRTRQPDSPAPARAPSQPPWIRAYPGSLIGTLAVLTGVLLWLGIRDAPHREAAWQTRFTAAAIACGLSMLALASFRFATAIRKAARGGRRSTATVRPLDTPAALRWRALTRSTAVTYAATALVAGGLGAAVLRAQERHAVRQFDQAGYNFFDEVQRSPFQHLREQAIAELHESRPSTLP